MLQTADSIVVLIDVQGKLAELMYDKQQLYRQLLILLRGARILKIPILWLEQYPQGLGPTVPEIAAVLGDLEPIDKTSFSACGSPRFQQALLDSGRKSVVVAGIESHVCVYQTARDLLTEGYRVEVVADAVSSRSVDNRHAGLQRMAHLGAGMMSTEMLLFEWLRESGSAEFKEISRLVR
ncbi:MAG: hydrolase [bacterium]|nr:hydrolase [bacterium]